MKKLLFALVVLSASLMSCDKEDMPVIPEATIEGRWVLEGFEETIRYEFTEDKRYTLYATDGVFPTLEEFIAENPGVGENDWYYEGEVIVIDLNFGNFSRVVPSFKCDNVVVDLIQEDGTLNSTLYRESHDITSCN